MHTRIGTQLIAGASLAAAATIGAMAVLVVRAHERDLVGELTRGADQLSETIISSTHEDMLGNQRDRLHRLIQTIGAQPGIDSVRVFNKKGRIVFSTVPLELGRTVDKRAESSYDCHDEGRPLERLEIRARSRIFRAADGHRVLGIVNPVSNQPSCATAACHAHSPKDTVLGVLDVTLSLAEVDRDIARANLRLFGMAAAAIAGTGLILWFLNRRLVLGPVEALAAGTRRVAEGDLTVTLPAEARHELGDLARAFNDMVRRLGDAQRQLAQADKLASVGRLAAGVAHEINNPLTGVLTYASFLLKRSADADTRSDLEVIVRETKRCREIVRNLLDFARQTPPRRHPTDVNEVVRRAVLLMSNPLALRHVALELDLAAELPAVPADANQVQQVVVNLLVNAADSLGDAGGRVRLATRSATLPAWGNAPIRKAACPRGCDLLDATFRIGGLPSIRVRRGDALVHLDPVYGRFRHADRGAGVPLCPRCGASLQASARCGACGGPTLAVEASGSVLWCQAGCPWSRWEARETAGPEGVVEIVVSDDGPGIPKEALPHLFEPFFTTKGSRGTGLGLAVTWGIVEAHDGLIEVSSEAGQGARFTVRLPLLPQRSAAEAA